MCIHYVVAAAAIRNCLPATCHPRCSHYSSTHRQQIQGRHCWWFAVREPRLLIDVILSHFRDTLLHTWYSCTYRQYFLLRTHALYCTPLGSTVGIVRLGFTGGYTLLRHYGHARSRRWASACTAITPKRLRSCWAAKKDGAMCHLRVFESVLDSIIVRVPPFSSSSSVQTLGRSSRCLAATALNPIGNRPRVKREVFFFLLGTTSTQWRARHDRRVMCKARKKRVPTQDRKERRAKSSGR